MIDLYTFFILNIYDILSIFFLNKMQNQIDLRLQIVNYCLS